MTHLTETEIPDPTWSALMRDAFWTALDRLSGVPTEPVVTGRRWSRPKRVCPDFCEKDHRCTAQHGYPSGEHRSMDETERAAWGSATYTRVETIDGVASLEIRLRVKLSSVRPIAKLQALFYRIVLSRAVAPAHLVAIEQSRLVLAGQALPEVEAQRARPALPGRWSA